MTNVRKTKAVLNAIQSMYHYDAIENGKLLHYSLPVQAIDADALMTLVKSDKTIDDAIIGSLFVGTPLLFTSGSSFVKAINANRAKGQRVVSKNDVKAAYDKFQVVARILELNHKPLQALWDTFTAQKMTEREAIKKENLKLVASGEKPKTLPRIIAPTVNGILAMLKPDTEVDHLASAIKSMKTAYNHFMELKGTQAQTDSDKLKALIIANGGEV